MDRLAEYISLHPFPVSLAGALLLAVIAFELRVRRMGFAALLPQEAVRLMNQGAAVYDLRDAEAFAAGHIGNAKHLSPEQREQAADVLKRHREKFLVLYCEDGSASSALARKLHAAGFTKTFNLRGGLATWRAESLPLVR